MAKRLAFVLVVGLLASLLHAQQGPVYKPGEYPSPRYPKVPKNPTIEDLMPTARAVVKRSSIGAMFYPGWAIKPGERALIVVNKDYNPLVLEALQRAIREAGAQVDLLLGGEGWLPGGEGATEFSVFTFMRQNDLQYTGGLTPETTVALALAGNYNILLSRGGGGFPAEYPKDKLRWEYLPWTVVDQFLIGGAEIPPGLLRFIDDAAWDMLSKAVSVHATDPEGTDISWSVKPQDWQVEGAHNTGHLMSHPRGGVGATGVIAGTWNHTGPYPAVRASFNKDQLVGMEGGGAYAQKWRDMKDQWKDVNWPGKQGPGLFSWLFEAAVGTNPKALRPKNALEHAKGNNWERTRAGMIHWGIGMGSSTSGESAQFFKEHPDVPTGHVHIHNYFLTMVLTNADGSKTTFIDKGHLTVLDDPKVRQEAAKYGDPDELLRESWIPAIPGINIPGDYWKDYANDPAAFVRKDLANWSY